MSAFDYKLILRGEKRPTWLGVLILLVAILIGAGLASDHTLNEKVVLLRYLNFLFAGVLAFATPWVLFPQISIYLFQAFNPDRRHLMGIFIARIGKVVVPGAALLTSAAFMGSTLDEILSTLTLWAENIALLAGLIVYITYRYVRMGEVSQLWQEGKRGEKFMAYSREAGGVGVPAGSLPTIGTTLVTSIAGMMAVVFGAYAQGLTGLPLNALGGIILLIIGLLGWRRILLSVDVEFYHTHGFYSELFHNPGGKADGGRDPIPVQALYWVPGFIKSMVWLSLRQMDRKIPVGRIIAAGFFLYWVFTYTGLLQAEAMFAIPFIIILIKNALILRLTAPVFAPRRFQQRMGTSFQWFTARSFINLRWTLPLMVLTIISQWFMSDLNMTHWWQWVYFDIAAAIGFAAFATLRLENRLKNDYA